MDYTGMKRRATDMGNPTDQKDIGMLIATVESLKREQARTAKVTEDIYREMEKLGEQFSDYKTVHDAQSAVDYKYLDAKIAEETNKLQRQVDMANERVQRIEHERDLEKVAIQAAKAKAEEIQSKSVGKKFTDAMIDNLAKLGAVGIVGLFFALMGIYLANGQKWPW